MTPEEISAYMAKVVAGEVMLRDPISGVAICYACEGQWAPCERHKPKPAGPVMLPMQILPAYWPSEWGNE